MDIDFSEIMNEQDDSWEFVDFNILESARQELEEQKNNNFVTEIRVAQKPLQPIVENNEDSNGINPKNIIASKLQKYNTVPAEIPAQEACYHNGIKPVFDWMYWAKSSNLIVDKLIHNNLVSKYKDSDLISLELSMVGKKIENNLATTTLANHMHSTAVSNMHAGSASMQKQTDEWKFHSMYNSMAKIKIEQQNSFVGK